MREHIPTVPSLEKAADLQCTPLPTTLGGSAQARTLHPPVLLPHLVIWTNRPRLPQPHWETAVFDAALMVADFIWQRRPTVHHCSTRRPYFHQPRVPYPRMHHNGACPNPLRAAANQWPSAPPCAGASPWAARSHGLRQPHNLRRLVWLRLSCGFGDLMGCGVPMGCGDPVD